MRLGVSYIVFDGVELLEHSIKQLRKHADYIQVIYQHVSWFGKKANPSDYAEIVRLKRAGIVDDISIFETFRQLNDYSQNSILQAKKYERDKRQLGLSTCRSKGCTHYLCMDVDEFYLEEEFIKAKRMIIDHNIEYSAVKFINYVNVPILHRGMDSSTVPFICKINSNSRMGKRFFSKCDPTRGIFALDRNAKNHLFNHSIIKMHHMETVRKDLKSKYQSTTRSVFNRSMIDKLVDNVKSINESTETFSFNKVIFPGIPPTKLIKVDNIFKIPYDKW